VPTVACVIATESGTIDGACDLDVLLSHPPAPIVEVDADTIAVLMFTSGTAGSPRAAMLSHGNLLANLQQGRSANVQIDADDVVYGVRADRSSDSWFKRTTAHLFYKGITALADTHAPAHAGDFRMMSRATVDAVNALPEHGRVLRFVVPALNFPAAALGVLAYALTSQLLGRTVPGWTSTVVIVAATGAVQLLALGILGEYVGRMYAAQQARPTYFVAYDSLTAADES
jgi:acyl-CoA synthetase (AMP-forming)/AMP-acid ligase II